MTARALSLARPWAIPAAIAAGCVAVATKPVSFESTPNLLLVGAAGAFGVVHARAGDRATLARWAAVTAVGIAAFAMGRALASPIGIHYGALGIAMIVIAGVCEEAFFRRFVYGWALARGGTVAAVLVSSVLFAVVHVPTYGWGAFPIDLAAGLVLGWQRASTGGWSSPAVTHIVANLFQMG